MEEKNAHIDELVSKLLTEGLGKAECEELDAWMSRSDENRRYVMQCQEVWFSAIAEEESKRYDASKAYAAFHERIAESQRKEEKRSFLVKTFYRYAAVVAALVLVAIFSYRSGETNLKQSLAAMEVEVPLGSQSKLRLPDGTLVVLNAGSRIAYPQDFGVDSRRVELEGEGYFEVEHDAKKPFYVCSENLQVKVLGTKFNFRDYPDDEQAVVSLLEGKVALDNLMREEEELTLLPDERVVLDKRAGQMKKKIGRKEQVAAWTKGRLSFDEVPLGEVAKILERSYDVRIHFADEVLRSYRFYGNFSRTGQSLEDILEALEKTGKVHYTVSDREITLY